MGFDVSKTEFSKNITVSTHHTEFLSAAMWDSRLDWPDETRINIVGANGNTGEHYDKSGLTTAADFLSEGMRVLTERGQQYGSGERECSFPQVAQAFNAITGRDLAGSDICLILALVKQVRQYVQPERFHEDSAVDGVNYTALQAEQLKRERSK